MKQGIKKAVVGVLAVSMALSMGATSAFAAGTGNRRNFVDTDGDGICDHYTTRQTTSQEVNFSQNGRGRNFVDADGDGICDNYGTRQGRGYCGGRNK